MKAAAITNSGSAIRVGELSSLMTSWASADQRLAGDQEHRAGAQPEHQEDRHAGGKQADEQRRKAVMRPRSIDAGSSWPPDVRETCARSSPIDTTSPTSLMT